jgi:spermidine/putrescine transport system substrate-binding protein
VVAGDDGQTMLERGDVDIAIEYSGDILSLILECECEDFAYSVPDEGSSFYAESVAVPVDGQNPELAMVFIEYLLDPAVAAEISTFTAYATPNQAALDGGFIPEADLNNPAIYPPEETLANLFLPIDVSPEAEQIYNDVWAELLISVGTE